jgi:hypothetical protein
MIILILFHLYRLHLHPILKKHFPFLQNSYVAMILEPVKNKSEVLSKQSEVINDLAL